MDFGISLVFLPTNPIPYSTGSKYTLLFRFKVQGITGNTRVEVLGESASRLYNGIL